MDFQINYRRDTGFGGIDLALAGNHQFSRKLGASAAVPACDDIGSLRAERSWNYKGCQDIVSTTQVPPTSSILNDVGLTLNMKSVFDQYPPALATIQHQRERLCQRLHAGADVVLMTLKKF